VPGGETWRSCSKEGRERGRPEVRFQAASDQALLVYLGRGVGRGAAARSIERVVQLLATPASKEKRLRGSGISQPCVCSSDYVDAALGTNAEVQAKTFENTNPGARTKMGGRG